MGRVSAGDEYQRLQVRCLHLTATRAERQNEAFRAVTSAFPKKRLISVFAQSQAGRFLCLFVFFVFF